MAAWLYVEAESPGQRVHYLKCRALTWRSSSFRVGTEGAEVVSGVGVGVEKVFRGNFSVRVSSSLLLFSVAAGVAAGSSTVATGTSSGEGDTTRAPTSIIPNQTFAVNATLVQLVNMCTICSEGLDQAQQELQASAHSC